MAVCHREHKWWEGPRLAPPTSNCLTEYTKPRHTFSFIVAFSLVRMENNKTRNYDGLASSTATKRNNRPERRALLSWWLPQSCRDRISYHGSPAPMPLTLPSHNAARASSCGDMPGYPIKASKQREVEKRKTFFWMLTALKRSLRQLAALAVAFHLNRGSCSGIRKLRATFRGT